MSLIRQRNSGTILGRIKPWPISAVAVQNGFSAGFGCYISGRKRDETDVGLLLRQAGGAPRTFAWVQGAAERGSVVAPPGTPGLRRARFPRRRGSGDDRGQRGEFGVARVAADDAQEWPVFGHSGMFPCFLGGNDSRLFRSSDNARAT